MNGASCSCSDRSALHEAFGLAFRLHIWNRVNFVVLDLYVYVRILYSMNQENMPNYNQSNWRDETSE